MFFEKYQFATRAVVMWTQLYFRYVIFTSVVIYLKYNKNPTMIESMENYILSYIKQLTMSNMAVNI